MSETRLIAEIPAPTPTQPWDFPPTDKLTMKNGVEVFCSHMPGVSLGAIGFSLGYSPVDDPAGKEGLASLTTQLLLSGISGGDAADFGRTLDTLGAHVQCQCTPAGTFVGGYAPATQLADFAALLAKVRTEATLADREIELGLSRGRYNAQMVSSYGQGVASLALRSALYPSSQRAHLPIDGTAASLAAITAADVRELWQEKVTTCPAQVFICADLDHIDVPALIAPFEAWETSGPFELLPPAHQGMEPSAVTIIDWPEEPQTQVIVTAAAGRLNDPHCFGAEVANQLLGVGTESLLFYRLREDHGWTYGVHSAVSAGARFGSFVIQSAVNNDAACDALGEIFNVWDEFTASEISAERHHQAVVELAGMLAASAESPLDIVEHAAAATQRGLAYDDVAKRINAYHTTTPTSVREDFAAFVERNHLHVVMVGDAKAITEKLPAPVAQLPRTTIAVADFVDSLS